MKHILASFGLWLVRRFSTVRPGEVLVQPRPNLMGIRDERVWAKEFVSYQTINPAIGFDEETMAAWFASAICVGYDDAKTHQPPIEKAQPVPMTIDDWLNTWGYEKYGSGKTSIFFILNEHGVTCCLEGIRGSTSIKSQATAPDTSRAFSKTVVEAEKTIGAKWRAGLPFSPAPLLVERSESDAEPQSD